MGAVDSLKLFGMEFLNFCDYLTAQILLPLGGFLTCIFIGWYVPKKIVWNEFTNWDTLKGTFFNIWFYTVRFVCPVGIAAIFLHQFGII
jgi:NSS family neurotransmitter:Na+ symporter